MSRWKELPDSVDDRVRQLVAQLRRMKDLSGLSLAALAAETTYSKSSWERYLNGKTLPPQDAVAELARVAGTDPDLPLTLHADAEAAREQPAPPVPHSPAVVLTPVTPPPVVPRQPDAPWPGRLRRRPTLVALAAVVLASAVPAGWAPWEEKAPQNPRISAHEGETYTADGERDHPCRVHHYEGRLYAGHSPTAEAALGYGSNGWEVVEVQCLLQEAGFDPGRADGIYGDRTIRAVRKLQGRAGIAQDGNVGPDTWKVLRGVTPSHSTA